MTLRILSALLRDGALLMRGCDGSIAIQFALALLPIAGVTGFAVDYNRALDAQAELQNALDAAVLAGVTDEGEDWSDSAQNAFNANVVWRDVPTAEPSFDKDEDGNVNGTIHVAIPTRLVRMLGMASMDLSVSATAAVTKQEDHSCLLSLDQGSPVSNNSLLFNGAPNVNFNECTIRSNTSIRCNGHSGGSIASIAAGSVSGCSNPQSNATVVPDIYASLASNITATCGASRPGKTWTPGSVPAGVTPINKGSYIEYHICGNLKLSGNGYLTGSAPSTDSVIIVENGNLTIADKSAIQTKRVAIVLTGNNSFPSSIKFPNGNGKAANLSLSPPTDVGNPWRGVSLYQDPALTNGVDNNWGPGATLNPDGVVYLPNSGVTLRGNSASNIARCTKFVANSFQTNGSVNLSFEQIASGCASLGVEQWFEVTPHLTN